MSGMRLESALDGASAAAVLADASMTGARAARKGELFTRCARALADDGIELSKDVCAFFVPGRIEVLGKHTDYAGGRTMVAACEYGFCVVAAGRRDAEVRILHVESGERVRIEIDPDVVPAHGHWSNYPMTVVRRLARNFPDMAAGVDIAFLSDLPPASGMSSSSAMMIAFSLALCAVNRLTEREEYMRNITSMEALAEYLATIENGQTFGTLVGDKGVGTFGGSEDHIAILCGAPDKLSQCSYSPVRFERHIPLEEEYVFAVAMSGVHAEKTGRARELYNRASLLASAVAEAWRTATGRDDRHIAAALAGESDVTERMRTILRESTAGGFAADDLLRRFEHFVAESEEIVPAAGDALASGDIAEFGAQVVRSQELTETLLGNQVPETVFLAASAREAGAAAASAFGAGFGGSVWALVEQSGVEGFLKDWKARYAARFPEAAPASRFFATRPGPAAMEIVWEEK